MIHVYTGDGKGKTTAALGLALRAVGAGKRVGIIFFDKGGVGYSEREAIKRLAPELEYWAFGASRADFSEGGHFRFGNTEADLGGARQAMVKAGEMVASDNLNLVILDEIISSINTGLVKIDDVLAIISHRKLSIELVLTGRGCPPEIIEKADLVSEIREIKHYFRQGVPARGEVQAVSAPQVRY